jgi:hypothetical protein
MHPGPMANTSSRADATAEADLLDTNAFEEADDAPQLRLLRPHGVRIVTPMRRCLPIANTR